MPPVAPVLRGARKRNSHLMDSSKHLVCPTKGKYRSDMTGGLIRLFARASSWVDSVYVWFPAAWMLLVADAIRAKLRLHKEVEIGLRNLKKTPTEY